MLLRQTCLGQAEQFHLVFSCMLLLVLEFCFWLLFVVARNGKHNQCHLSAAWLYADDEVLLASWCRVNFSFSVKQLGRGHGPRRVRFCFKSSGGLLTSEGRTGPEVYKQISDFYFLLVCCGEESLSCEEKPFSFGFIKPKNLPLTCVYSHCHVESVQSCGSGSGSPAALCQLVFTINVQFVRSWL